MSNTPSNSETLFQHRVYDPAKTFLYKACIRVAHNCIYVLLADKQSNEPRLLKKYPTQLPNLNKADILPLNEMLGQLDEVKTDISQFAVLIEHERHTMIPDVLFEKEQALALYSSCNEILAQEELSVQKLPRLNAVMVFPFNRYTGSLLNSRFKSPALLHESAALANYLISNDDNSEKMVLYYQADFITLLYRQNKTIRFVNSFKSETENDALYFVLATLEEFGWKNTQTLYVCGDIAEQDLMHALLKKYIRQVEWLSPGMGILNDHKYFPLYAAALCE